MPLERRPHEPRSRRPVGLALATAATLALAGCQGGPFAAWRAARDDSLSKAPTTTELGDDRGLMARWLTPKPVPHTDPTKTTPLVKGLNGWQPAKVVPNAEAEAEFKAAYHLFEQQQYPEAEKAFTVVAKKRKGTPWGEKSQFYLAESYYQEGKLVYAHDALDTLFKDYPGTLYMDKLVSREYAIGEGWLALADAEVKPATAASSEDSTEAKSPTAAPSPASALTEIPWTGRFDGRRPLLDERGYAIQVFEHVRQHDATGPLADDATLKLADIHMKMADYETAALYYDQLAAEYPKSPYLQRAQLSAIDARMKGYIGPEYDGSGLEKARELIKQTMTTFPDRPAGNEKLFHTLDVINDQEAERTYRTGEFYRRTGMISSAEYYFGKVPQRWPKSPWAVKAKEELVTLAKMPRKPTLPSRMLRSPSMSDPFSGPGTMNGGMGGGGMGGMGGGGMGGGGMGGMGGMGMM